MENSEKVEITTEEMVEELKRELEEERKRSDQLQTRMKYLQADLENNRKRMDREVKEAGESTARRILAKLIVVADELDLAVKHSERQKGNGELTEGIEMVRRNLWSVLESEGVQRIDSVGKPFDPSVHEAVEKVQGTTNGEDMVSEEVRSGFIYKGQLLRPSMVKVQLAMKKSDQEAED